MVSGKQVRLSRITESGRMLCVPMDHAVSTGPVKGLDRIYRTIEEVELGGGTAVLTHKGILKHMPRPPRIGHIVHLSGSTSLGPDPNWKVLVGEVVNAIRLGADAVSVHVNIGSRAEPQMLEKLGRVADACDDYGMPLIAMMYPRGENVKDPSDPKVIAHVARVGAELGADVVKVPYTGSPETFRAVVESCPAPVVMAGGPKSESDVDVLEMAYGAMKAGAMGVTIGRNVFMHDRPRSIVAALRRIVIEGRTVEEALRVVQG
ncbi:MAG: 2-amino-3,7-dideoxy-D-threo-hept-6-ulosonate synthase [Thaumarchaeota archaeon]|nr:2-amino-3,7-dideoxy-D-threo-hept-6-ulosonate synthase [Candidatus Calditenuaceae archaeon]MCX8203449.1 2-amino-3,7-dideoxy-D-threo-hept-6-ulosonate synthase [Nitrososphaeria archaeon]MDW8043029.1 2-amino-3,7-dideoxy-D-threo-hept-6-ulosonate synthase [Nitrososphaerota archaeon]